MNLDNLTSMFSQRSGAQQSMAGTIMNTIMGYMMQNFMQKGMGSFLNSGGSDTNSIKSALSQLGGGLNDPNHPLVQQVKRNSGLQDDNQAKQYTQQGVGLLRENADSDPQGLSSLLGSFGGGIENLAGGLLSGGGQQQQNKKQGGIGDMLGL